jgi:flagellum-specific peptidoglycan hydrolase FlgJ
MLKQILFFFTILISLVACNATKSVYSPSRINILTESKKLKKTTVETTTMSIDRNKNIKKGPTETIVSTSKTTVTSEVVSNYIFRYKDVAMNNMKNYGIPASIILAQAILESGAGMGDLSLSANNHFGIKCHSDWTGESVRHDDDSSQECFRKYNQPEESFRDHALFLGKSRYANLFLLPKGDYESWAKGLKSAGYATDPKYPDKLISYIIRYNLSQYDNLVLGKKDQFVPKEPAKQNPIAVTDTTLYEVQKGDTFYSISKKLNLTVEYIKCINDFETDSLSIGQKIKIN